MSEALIFIQKLLELNGLDKNSSASVMDYIKEKDAEIEELEKRFGLYCIKCNGFTIRSFDCCPSCGSGLIKSEEIQTELQKQIVENIALKEQLEMVSDNFRIERKFQEEKLIPEINNLKQQLAEAKSKLDIALEYFLKESIYTCFPVTTEMKNRLEPELSINYKKHFKDNKQKENGAL